MLLTSLTPKHMYSYISETNFESSTKIIVPTGYTFKCDVCEKHFSHSSRLKLHVHTHNYKGPFACDVCKKSFKQLENMKLHLRSHSGQLP